MEKLYIRVNKDGVADASGDYIIFGSYPQSYAYNQELGKISKEMAKPTSKDCAGWTSYKYYVKGDNSHDFMWYKDMLIEGEKYRSVYLDCYRPWWTEEADPITEKCHMQDIGLNVAYLYKYQPILWKILKQENGKALLLSQKILDAQCFHYTHTAKDKIYANNYEHSYIRNWLNNVFYQQAFSQQEKEIINTVKVDNTKQSAGEETEKYCCNDTEDKVFLLSYKEATSTEFGFKQETDWRGDTARQKQATSYAKSQGIYESTGEEGVGVFGTCEWLLRSPGPTNREGYYASSIGISGRTTSIFCRCTSMGVVPAIVIDLEK